MPKYCRDKGEKLNTRGHHESLFFTWEINCLCSFLFRHVFSQTFLPFFLASRNYHGQAQAAPKFSVGCGRNFQLIHGGWWKLRTLAHTVFWHIKKKTQFRAEKSSLILFLTRVWSRMKRKTSAVRPPRRYCTHFYAHFRVRPILQLVSPLGNGRLLRKAQLCADFSHQEKKKLLIKSTSR